MALLKVALVSTSSARSSSQICPTRAAAPPMLSTAPVSQEMKCHKSGGISRSTAPIDGGEGAAVCAAEGLTPTTRGVSSAAHARRSHEMLEAAPEDISAVSTDPHEESAE